MAGMDWGAIGSAAVSTVGSLLGGRSSAAAQYRYTKKLYKNRYQWQTKDMIAAGINPMVSAMSGAPTAGSVSAPDYASAVPKGVAAYYSAKQANAQIENTNQATDTSRAQGNLAMAQGHAQELDNVIKEASPEYQNAKKAVGDAGQIGPSAAAAERYDYQTQALKANADAAASAAEKAAQDVRIAKTQADQAEALKPLLVEFQEYMNKAAKLKIPAAEAEAKFFKDTGSISKYGPAVDMVLNALKIFIHGRSEGVF